MSGPVRPVILCGGAGTRLWPASRDSLPKQFLPLTGERSSLQETVLRAGDKSLFGKPIVITHRDYRFLVREQLAEIGAEADIVLEPARRDSAPAIAAASMIAARENPGAVLLALAADHFVRKPGKFVKSVRAALPAARAGHIVTFGMKPDRPATGYGYIKPGKTLSKARPACAVKSFVEKPDTPTARKYLKQGYLWNSGNFLFRADVFLGEYGKFSPKSAREVSAAVGRMKTDLGFLVLGKNEFSAAEKKSVDYAIMEHTNKAAVVAADYGWSDVGGWHALWELSKRDKQGNAVKGNVVALGSRNTYASSTGKLTALLGAENLVVVVEDDAVLVASQNRAEDLKALVEALRKEKHAEADTHARVLRPWGSYQGVDRGEGFLVKRIVVNPGGKLSLQKHKHRAEHWVVVNGTAKVTIGGGVKILKANESTYIPLGEVHRLENPGSTPLELIEVQTGTILDENDIVRIEDIYKREND